MSGRNRGRGGGNKQQQAKQLSDGDVASCVAFANHTLASRGVSITSVATDLGDGAALCALLNVLGDGAVGSFHAQPNGGQQVSANRTALLAALRTVGIPCNAAEQDFDNTQTVVSLLWGIIQHFHVLHGATTKGTRASARDVVLAWVRTQLDAYLTRGVWAENLHKSFGDGKVLPALVDSVCPGKLNLATGGKPAISAALKVACDELAVPEDVLPESALAGKISETSVMIFVAYLRNAAAAGTTTSAPAATSGDIADKLAAAEKRVGELTAQLEAGGDGDGDNEDDDEIGAELVALRGKVAATNAELKDVYQRYEEDQKKWETRVAELQELQSKQADAMMTTMTASTAMADMEARLARAEADKGDLEKQVLAMISIVNGVEGLEDALATVESVQGNDKMTHRLAEVKLVGDLREANALLVSEKAALAAQITTLQTQLLDAVQASAAARAEVELLDQVARSHRKALDTVAAEMVHFDAAVKKGGKKPKKLAEPGVTSRATRVAATAQVDALYAQRATRAAKARDAVQLPTPTITDVAAARKDASDARAEAVVALHRARAVAAEAEAARALVAVLEESGNKRNTNRVDEAMQAVRAAATAKPSATDESKGKGNSSGSSTGNNEELARKLMELSTMQAQLEAAEHKAGKQAGELEALRKQLADQQTEHDEQVALLEKASNRKSVSGLTEEMDRMRLHDLELELKNAQELLVLERANKLVAQPTGEMTNEEWRAQKERLQEELRNATEKMEEARRDRATHAEKVRKMAADYQGKFDNMMKMTAQIKVANDELAMQKAQQARKAKLQEAETKILEDKLKRLEASHRNSVNLSEQLTKADLRTEALREQMDGEKARNLELLEELSKVKGEVVERQQLLEDKDEEVVALKAQVQYLEGQVTGLAETHEVHLTQESTTRGEVDKLHAQIAELEAEMEAIKVEAAAQEQRLKAAEGDRVAELRGQLEAAAAAAVAQKEATREEMAALEQEHAERVAALETSHRNKLAALETDGNDSVLSMQTAHDEETAGLKAAHEKKLAALTEKHAREVEALNTQGSNAADAHAKEVATLKDGHAKEVAALKDGHAAEVAALKAESGDAASSYDGQVTALKTSHETQVATLKASHEEQVAALKASHEEKVAALKASHEEKVAALKASHEEQVEALKAKLAAEEAATATKVAALGEKLAAAEATLAETRQREDKANERGERLKAQVDVLQASIKDLQEQYDQQRRKMRDVQQEADVQKKMNEDINAEGNRQRAELIRQSSMQAQTLLSKFTTKRGELETAHARIRKLEETEFTLRGRVEELEAEFASLSTKAEASRIALEDRTAEAALLRKQAEARTAGDDPTATEAEALSEDVDKLKSLVDQARGMMSESEVAHTGAMDAKDEAVQAREAAHAEQLALKASELESLAAEHARVVAAKDAQIAALQAEVAAHAEHAESGQETSAKHARESEALRGELEAARSEAASAASAQAQAEAAAAKAALEQAEAAGTAQAGEWKAKAQQAEAQAAEWRAKAEAEAAEGAVWKAKVEQAEASAAQASAALAKAEHVAATASTAAAEEVDVNLSSLRATLLERDAALKAADEKHARAVHDVDEARKATLAANKEKSKVMAELKVVRKQLAQAEEDKAVVEGELAEVSRVVLKSKRSSASLETNIVTMQTTLAQTAAAKQKADIKALRLKSELEELKTASAEEVEDLTLAMERMRTELEGAVAEKDEQLAAERAAVAEAQRAASKEASGRKAAERKAASMESEVAELRENVQGAEARLAHEVEAMRAAKDIELSDAKREHMASQGKVQVLQGEIAGLLEGLKNAKENTDAKNQEIARISMSKQQLDMRFKATLKRLSEVERSVAELKRELRRAEQAHDQIEGEMDSIWEITERFVDKTKMQPTSSKHQRLVAGLIMVDESKKQMREKMEEEKAALERFIATVEEEKVLLEQEVQKHKRIEQEVQKLQILYAKLEKQRYQEVSSLEQRLHDAEALAKLVPDLQADLEKLRASARKVGVEREKDRAELAKMDTLKSEVQQLRDENGRLIQRANKMEKYVEVMESSHGRSSERELSETALLHRKVSQLLIEKEKATKDSETAQSEKQKSLAQLALAKRFSSRLQKQLREKRTVEVLLVKGTPIQGRMLRAVVEVPEEFLFMDPEEFEDSCSFQWYRADESRAFHIIDGATMSSYVPTADDIGMQLQCQCSLPDNNSRVGMIGPVAVDNQLEEEISTVLAQGAAKFRVTTEGGDERFLLIRKDRIKVLAPNNTTLNKHMLSSSSSVALRGGTLLEVHTGTGAVETFHAESKVARDVIALVMRRRSQFGSRR